MQHYKILITLIVTSLSTTNYIISADISGQLKIIYPFFKNTTSIASIKETMNEIEHNKLGYPDYANRTGLIWSDVKVRTSLENAIIRKEYNTEKATFVNEALKTQHPQSILTYPTALAIVSREILPTMFTAIKTWRKLPETAYAQIFFQRCSTSDPMDWHQDPGEDYHPQGDYSLVLMLSDQAHAQHGWHGGLFNIRAGLPNDSYHKEDVTTMAHRYNQGIIFNNQTHSHSVTEVIPTLQKAERDLIVIIMSFDKLPTKKGTS